MSSIGVSEFTFGFAFLYEQVHANWIGMQVAPILPSLQMEKDHGWDVSIPFFGVPFFYQFKIAEYLHAAHATYINNGTYAGPYYRIDLHKPDNNQQHRLLKELADEFPNTFYAAPEIHTGAEFTEHFLAATLVDNSRIIPISDCDNIGPLDGSQHRITFQPGNPQWAFHSEFHPKHKSYRGRAGIKELYDQSRESWTLNDEDYAENLLDRLVSVRNRVSHDKLSIDKVLRKPRRRVANNSFRTHRLAQAADLLACEFGVSMLIVGNRSTP